MNNEEKYFAWRMMQRRNGGNRLDLKIEKRYRIERRNELTKIMSDGEKNE